jgi:hypothetical protein
MINPLNYLKLVKNDIIVTSFLNNKIYFDTYGFRSYSSKNIIFIFNNSVYNGIFKTYQKDNEPGLFYYYIEIETSLNLIVNIGDNISVFSTFNIDDEESELVTLQDIYNKLISVEGKYKGYLGNLILIESGKSGLLNYLDKAKLNQKSILVLNSETLELTTNFSTLINIKKEFGIYYEFELSINNEILKFKVSFDINNNILIDNINVSLTTNNLLEFQFVEKTYDAVSFIEIRTRALSNLSFNWAFSTPNYLNHILPNEVVNETEIVLIGGSNTIIFNSAILCANSISITSSGNSLSENVTSDITIGAINAGDVLDASLNFLSFVKKLVKKTFYPTFTAPSSTLTLTGISASTESGTINNLTLTVGFNRGSILGKLINSIWNAATLQDYRAGIANNYNINGFDNGLSNVLVINNQEIIDGANNFNSIVSYNEGPQPLDSSNENYGAPLVAGSLNKTSTINGYRNCFYGNDSVDNIILNSSAQIRLLSGKLLNPIAGSTFVISIPIGTKKVTIAYPATIRDISSILYVEGLNAEIKSIFTKTEVIVEGANNYAGINYKVFTYVPAEQFSTSATYTVTI